MDIIQSAIKKNILFLEIGRNTEIHQLRAPLLGLSCSNTSFKARDFRFSLDNLYYFQIIDETNTENVQQVQLVLEHLTQVQALSLPKMDIEPLLCILPSTLKFLHLQNVVLSESQLELLKEKGIIWCKTNAKIRKRIYNCSTKYPNIVMGNEDVPDFPEMREFFEKDFRQIFDRNDSENDDSDADTDTDTENEDDSDDSEESKENEDEDEDEDYDDDGDDDYEDDEEDDEDTEPAEDSDDIDEDTDIDTDEEVFEYEM